MGTGTCHSLDVVNGRFSLLCSLWPVPTVSAAYLLYYVIITVFDSFYSFTGCFNETAPGNKCLNVDIATGVDKLIRKRVLKV